MYDSTLVLAKTSTTSANLLSYDERAGLACSIQISLSSTARSYAFRTAKELRNLEYLTSVLCSREDPFFDLKTEPNQETNSLEISEALNGN